MTSSKNLRNDKIEAYIMEIDGDDVKIRLKDRTEIWVKDRDSGISEKFIGKNAELTLVIIPNSVTTETFANVEEISEDLGVEKLSSGKLHCKVVCQVTDYDAEARWPEAKSKFGYPLVEMQAGIGKLVLAHENVHPVKEKQPYHKKGVKWKITSPKLMLENAELIE